MTHLLDISGQRFARLVAMKVAKREGTRTYWLCKCDCGKESVVYITKLRSGHTRSCGCYKMQRISETKKTHGMSGHTKVYDAWVQMRARCTNPSGGRFDKYQARGIVVCARWGASFEVFLKDMGLPPSPKHSLDRIDNDGNYEPGNCRWATPKEQARNKRGLRIVHYCGRDMPLSEALEVAGNLVAYGTAWCRIEVYGLAVAAAIETPPGGFR